MSELAGENGAAGHPLAHASPVVADVARAENPADVLGWTAAGFAALALGALGFRGATTVPARGGRHTG